MISVIIPTYNRAKFLAKGLESIFMQKDATYEVIIVDDCSSDDTGSIVNTYKALHRVKYIKNNVTKGPGYSRLLGLRESTGEYIVFMDDDDYYTDAFFYKKALAVFEKDKEQKLAFVSGNVQTLFLQMDQTVFHKLNIEGYLEGLEYLQHFSGKYNKPKSTFSSVFSKKKLEEAGVFQMRIVNDSSIYMRALLAGGSYILEDIIGVYVVHDTNISKSISAPFLIQNLEEKAAVRNCLKKHLDHKQIKEWWGNQASGTLQYYCLGSKPSIGEFKYVSEWIKNNSKDCFSWKLRKAIVVSFGTVIRNHIKNKLG